MATLPQSIRAPRALAAITCLFSLVQGCGRSDPEDYLYDSDGTISVGATAGVSGGGRSSGGTRATGGATGRAGSGNTGATGGFITVGGSVGIGGVGVGGSSPVGGTGQGGTSRGGTAGTGGSGVGGSGVAGSGGETGTPITCGNQSCDSNTQVCCASLGGFGCLSKNANCNGALLSCTTSADCSGNDVCCLSLTGNADTASSCKPACNGMGPGRDRQLCRVDADCAFPNRFCTATVFGVSVCTRR